MCYLRFDKAQMTNLQDSLFKELLITSRSGAYCNTTLVGCNIRKYHGLMVVPVPELDDENHVLLSSLDETVIQHGAEFNLGLHKYQGENYSPKGHKYIGALGLSSISGSRSVTPAGNRSFPTCSRFALISWSV